MNTKTLIFDQRKTVTGASAILSIYLREIGQVDLLTKEEEQKLAFKIRRGDDEARRRFIEANLRLVVHVAKQYNRSGSPEALLDLIQEGNLGLFRAVERFDPRKGYRFSTYAMYWIRQALQRHLSRVPIVRLPENVWDDVKRLKRTRHGLYQDLGRQPTTEELAAELDIPKHAVEKLEEYSQETVSLDQPIRGGQEGDETELKELLSDLDTSQPELIANQHLLRAKVREVLEELPARERRIIEKRFGLTSDGVPHTLEEVAGEFGVSRERIRQIQNHALERIRSRELLRSDS